MRPTLYQQRQQREQAARAANAVRLLDKVKAVLAKADAESRDLLPHEAQQGRALLNRVDRLTR
jgi:hypothetical protein